MSFLGLSLCVPLFTKEESLRVTNDAGIVRDQLSSQRPLLLTPAPPDPIDGSTPVLHPPAFLALRSAVPLHRFRRTHSPLFFIVFFLFFFRSLFIFLPSEWWAPNQNFLQSIHRSSGGTCTLKKRFRCRSFFPRVRVHISVMGSL